MELLSLVQTKDEIALQLKRAIFSGALKADAELTQEDIASQLGVSRMPVREALQLLKSEGLLVRLPNRHMRVVGVTPEMVQQTFSVLANLESCFLAFLNPHKDVNFGVLQAWHAYEVAVAKRQNLFQAEMGLHLSLSNDLSNFFFTAHPPSVFKWIFWLCVGTVCQQC